MSAWTAILTVACVALFLYGFFRQTRRELALPARATSLGLEYFGEPPQSGPVLDEMGPFALLQLGYHRSVRNLMRGARGAYELAVFEYGAGATREGTHSWRAVV